MNGPFFSKLHKQLLVYRQLITYLFVGLFNTIVAVAVIYIMQLLGNNYVVSNLIGYIVGIIVSFFLNSKITFKVRANIMFACKFVIALIIAYISNIAIVTMVINVIPDYPYLAQLSGVPFYIVLGYLLNKYWVFKE
jgi:putative flippase GtrA